MLATGGDDALDRADIAGVVELAGDAEEVRQIEVAEPETIDAVHGGDLLDGVETPLGFDLRDDEVAGIRRPHLGRRIARLVVVMREGERRPAPTFGRVMRRLGDGARLLHAIHHGNHHALRPDIEGARKKVILASRHPHHRRNADAAAVGALHLELLDGEAGMLHVVENIFAAGEPENLSDPGREELEDHRAQHRLCAHRPVA